MDLDLQKASMWKRISAFLFDFIMLSIVAVLFAWGLSAALGYDGYNRTVAGAYEKYSEPLFNDRGRKFIFKRIRSQV